MSVTFFDLVDQYVSIADEVHEAIGRVLSTQTFIMGPEVAALEEELGQYVGADHAVAVASGTDALLLPLKALEADPGAEVIIPAFTFFATAGAVWNAGLRPVFCDVDPRTYNVTAETIAPHVTERTVAIVPVHLYGQMAEMSGIMELARAHGAFVLEDCAQSIGADSPEGRAGSVGDAGSFSFFPTKNLGGFGDGGLTTFSDSLVADRVRKMRVHGGKKMYHHEMVGTNSRLDALQAAVLRVKLHHLDEWIQARRGNADRYADLLADVGEISLPFVADGHTHAYNQFTIRAERRDELRAFLTERGIGSGVYYPLGLHLQDCFSSLGYRPGDLPVTESLTSDVLSLPIFPELGEERVSRVAEAVREFYGYSSE